MLAHAVTSAVAGRRGGPARWISGLYMFVAADGLALKVC